VQTSLLAAALLLNAAAYDDIHAGRPYLTGGRDFDGPTPGNRLYRLHDGWLLTVAPERGAMPLRAEAQRILDDRQMTVAGAIAALARAGIPAVPVSDCRTLAQEPHMRENGLFTTVEQPELGPVTFPAPVLGPGRGPAPAPALGADNACLAAPWAP